MPVDDFENIIMPEGFFVTSSLNCNIQGACIVPSEIGFDKSLEVPYYAFSSLGGIVKDFNIDFTGGSLIFPTQNAYDRVMPEIVIKLTNDLRFNSEIVVAEDNEFNLRFINLARKLVFLPRYIGYTYVMNGGSLMHDMAKDDKGLLELCRGTKAFCDSAISTGLPVNDMMGSILGFTSACALMSTVSLETREEIKEMLSKYAHLIDKAEVNKLCDATESKLVNFVPKIAIDHPKLMYMLRRKREKKGEESK